MVCPYSLSRPGGVQGQAIGLARALAHRDVGVTVFAPLDAVSHAPSDIDLVVTGRSVSLPANGSVAPVTLSMRAVRYARRMLVSGDFDVVHVHEPFTPGVPYGLLLGRGIPPVVATFHRSGPSVFYRTLRPITRKLSGRFAVQCAVSEAASATASRALGGTVDIVFNGVEVDLYQHVDPWPSDRPTVLFLGRHEERKGLHSLLEAAAKLEDVTGAHPGDGRGGRPRLWIAGDGPQTSALRRHHPDSADIEWLGVLSEEEKIRRLAAADVLCAPSLGGESFGMVLLEGMAARTVVVASDIDGYRAAAGRLAVLVPPGDAGALADALNGVLAGRLAVIDPVDVGSSEGAVTADDGRRRWVDEAAERASEFSMRRLAGRYEDYYRSAMVRSRG
jgi:phosphatidylinositol alpha-mannosyltransferase